MNGDHWRQIETIFSGKNSETWISANLLKIRKLDNQTFQLERNETWNFLLFCFHSWRIFSAKSAVTEFFRFSTAIKIAKKIFLEWRELAQWKRRNFYRKFDQENSLCLKREIWRSWRENSTAVHFQNDLGTEDPRIFTLRLWRWHDHHTHID